MSFDEFQLLSQNIRVKNMLYAAIVPGHIHFKAQSPHTGYWIAGVRSAALITMGAVYIQNKQEISNLTFNDIIKEDDTPNYKKIFYGSAAVAIGTYLFDLIHGEAVLSQKQEQIRYKYSIQISNQSSIIGFKDNLSLKLKINF